MKPTHTSNLEEIKKKLPKAQKEFHEQNGWRFEFQKSGIMPSEELDALQEGLALNAIPDVVYGENYVRFMLPSADLCLEFTARDSLLLTNFTARGYALLDRKLHADLQRYSAVNNVMHVPSEVKVKYAEHWKNKKIDDPETEIKNITQISDVFFSSAYKGTVKDLPILAQPQDKSFLQKLLENPLHIVELSSVANTTFPFAEHTLEEIPIHNLTEANEIIWTNQAYLWEDELGDSGSTTSEVRFRVMGDCWFALLRQYLRVDEVLIRIMDTRFYHEFGKNYVLREFQVREDSFSSIAQKGFHFTPKWMLDQGQSHIIYPYLDVISIERERIVFQ